MRIPLLLVVAAGIAGCGDKEGCAALVQYFEDRDGDGYGNPDELQATCEPPEGFVDNAEDCDDRDADRYPGAPEICGDGEVNDCAGTVDAAAGACTVAGDVLPETAATASVSGLEGASLGASVANAGDIDRDDVDDQIIGAPGDDTVGTDAGAAWVFYGGLSGELDQGDSAGVLSGEAAGDMAGAAVASPGDMNGDGDSDLLIGAPGAEGGKGRIYLILQDMEEEIPLGEADLALTGEAADMGIGTVLEGVGDFNGDDQLDFVIGAPLADDGAGRLWLITSTDEGDSLADYDRQLLGAAAEDAAGTAALGGDLDGDGDTDLLVASPRASQTGDAGEDAPRNGAIYGILDTFIEPTPLTDGDTRLYGDVAGDLFGSAVASLGDINGDGYEDFAISSPGQGFSGPGSGAVYVVPGPLGFHTYAVVSASANARIDGQEDDGMLGDDLAGPGDVDGDGLDDLAIGMALDSTTAEGAGAVFSIFGPISGAVGLDASDGTEIGTIAAIHYLGPEANAALGTALVGAGDQDGNEAAELLVGAPGVGSGAGAAYLLRASGY